MSFPHFFKQGLSYIDPFFGKDFCLVRLTVTGVVVLLAILAFPIVLLLRRMAVEDKRGTEADRSAPVPNVFLPPYRQSDIQKI
ncbi:hypothetical protein G5B00_00260 [Parapedobacter sp. SGR-10]|uniref:hypothetical protein n=1 Tax=Parapedobacter sp. SGR-10 TaxID=2710879 RepID=UPI0013D353A4|nr:hypothetical protein [Parapedobacter sp. SGR-10]NGF54929.1 hypothetical protein [Parapedobacter sp. SGR-10]